VTPEVLRTAALMRAWRGEHDRVGLVPTMGALHAGHRSLVERAVAETDAAVVSIFVNPTQFGPGEDYRSYPRDLESDLALLKAAGAAAAFVPSVDEMYPPGDAARVIPGPIAEPLEGAQRPGHFSGVATVVTKLFALVAPARAYFGQKDFQQLRVIQQVTRDLALPVEIVPCPIVREPDGLALSSRNAYLDTEERERATRLSRGLFTAERAWRDGERDPRRLRERVADFAETAGDLEYVSVADPLTLEELEAPADRAVISLACRVGSARLIDNILLGMPLSELR